MCECVSVCVCVCVVVWQRGTRSATTALRWPRHVLVAGEEGHFAGWPANNGSAAWTWGDELLVGFSYGPFEEQDGQLIASEVVPSN